MPSGDDHMNPIASLLGAQNVKKLITHPYVSPLFGDFTGFPPLLIQCGDAECLRDEGTLLAHKASMAGVQVYHEVYEDCPHGKPRQHGDGEPILSQSAVFQALFFLEAAKKAFRSHRNFVKRVLPAITRASRVDLGSMDKEVMSDAHALKQNGEPEAQSLAASPSPEAANVWGSDSGKEDDTDAESPRLVAEGVSDSDATSEDGSSSVQAENQVGLHASDIISNVGQRVIGGLVEGAAKTSNKQQHDLDRVQEEQNEDIAGIDTDTDEETASRHTRYYTATSETRSTPNSPSVRQRHRSRSTLSLTSLTPTMSTIALPSPGISGGRPAHSRTPSSGTIRPGFMRLNSRPRARTNSHPDLQALLDSYEASPSQHTVLFTSADSSEDESGPHNMDIDRSGALVADSSGPSSSDSSRC